MKEKIKWVIKGHEGVLFHLTLQRITASLQHRAGQKVKRGCIYEGW